MSISGAFRFHAVGQGLFYSGLLNGTEPGRGVFSFVYDCGTLSAKRHLYREVDDFKPLLPHGRHRRGRRLDLLVVSHLHDDHVNGLEYLLDDVEVDTVVMPYVDQVTLLLARTESSDDDPFLRTFYADPIDWFASRGVRRILLVGAPPQPPQHEDFRGFTDDEGGLLIDREHILATARSRDTKVLYLERNATGQLSLFKWKFCFRNLELPDCIYYREVVEDFQREKMLTLDDIFHSKTLTKELAKRLRGVLQSENTVNRTSVVMTHEPELDDEDTSTFWSQRVPALFGMPFNGCASCDCDYYAKKAQRLCRKTILTGDVEARNVKEVKQLWEYDSHFAVIQYPHHGARGALPDDFNYMPYGWIPVFSAGLSHRYGHPHPSVLARQRYPVIVDERTAFDYRIFIQGKRQSGAGSRC